MKRHAGSEEVLASSTRCLSSMVTNPEYASALLKSGAMASMVESVIQNPEAEKVGLTRGVVLPACLPRGLALLRCRCTRSGVVVFCLPATVFC